jgi:predicted HD phosphohydrolase
MSTTKSETLSADTIVDFLADIFERRGGEEYLGEPVTMAEHMLQGAHFAEQAGEPEIIVVATLLHDIGHFTSEFGTFSMNDVEDRHHEEAGAKVLERFFPKLVTDCVRYHVAAKRYLCAARPEYLGKLSEASIHSLNLQGGPMNEGEVLAFELNQNCPAIIRVRTYDDAGKEAGLTTQLFSYYAPMVQRIVDAHCNGMAGRRRSA